MSRLDDLNRLLSPRAVAVVGASANPSKIGGQPLHTLSSFGFQGNVYPVNPNYSQINGLPCYRDPSSLPDDCDVAIVAVASSSVPDVVEQCGRKGIGYVIILSAGFAEAGDEGAELQTRIVEIARRHGTRIIGPNCQGVLSLPTRLYAGFGATFQNEDLATGRLAMVTQSGGFGYSVVGQADAQGAPFSHVISTGNEADVTAVDLVHSLLHAKDVDAVAMYLEGVRDGQGLRDAGRLAMHLGKPIIVWKVGRGTAGQRAAKSHTGNLTSGQAVYELAFREGGFIQVEDVHELVDVSRVLASKKRSESANVGVISISGGAGVVLADHLEDGGLTLPRLSEGTEARLREVTPSYASLQNPVDVTAQVFNDPQMFSKAVTILREDRSVGQLIISNAAMQGATAEQFADTILAEFHASDMPLAVAWSARPGTADGPIGRLRDAAVPVFETPVRAAKAVAAVTKFQLQNGRPIPERHSPGGNAKGAAVQLLTEAGPVLAERAAKQFLSVYGLSMAQEVLLPVEARAACPSALGDLPFPVVAKLAVRGLAHKAEYGLVQTAISNAEELEAAVREIRVAAERLPAGAEIEGISVQEQLEGQEMLLGTVCDEFFGPMVAVGLGGIYAEYLKDVKMRFAPVSPEVALEMLEELRSWPILAGARSGRRDVEALAQLVARVSEIAWLHRDDVREMDLNPVFVGDEGRGARIADALVVRKDAVMARSTTNGKLEDK